VGLLIGLERERRGKDAGLRTFAFVALFGGLGGLSGDSFSLLALVLVGVLVVILNLHAMQADHRTELTTSAALLVTTFAGILCGEGHRLTPSALGVVTVALLAWKGPLSGFSRTLSETELRSAILLGILAFVIYPALPEGAVDRWGLIEPRAALVIVILIAAIGFLNYVLLKLYGARGIELSGFLGGLVNSTVTAAEMAGRVREAAGLAGISYLGILFATVAMIVRNAVLLALLAPLALGSAWLSFALMLAVGLAFTLVRRAAAWPSQDLPQLQLASPFSITGAVKLGLLFLTLQVAGGLAQRTLGVTGFYAVSLIGGLLSSSSAVASAASLAAHGNVSPRVAGLAALLASMTSALVSLPLVARLSRDGRLTRRLALVLGGMVLAGLLGAYGQSWWRDRRPPLPPPAKPALNVLQDVPQRVPASSASPATQVPP
jgi:uncharacterized membrane protein (DUF4010 family)